MRLPTTCLLLCLAALPAGAQDKPEKPTLAAKSKSINVEITIDDKLRKDDRLYRGLLKDAERFIDERAMEADKEWREDKTMFRHGPWEYERGYYLNAEAGPYISLSVLNYSYTGGAHPNHRTTTILWDRAQGRRASIVELFRETKPGSADLVKLAELIREEVAKEKAERGAHVTRPLAKDDWISAIKADLKTMGAASLVPSTVEGKAAGIDFHFSAYDVGSYAEGAYGAYLSWQTLAPFLTAKARGHFAGERADEPKAKQN